MFAPHICPTLSCHRAEGPAELIGDGVTGMTEQETMSSPHATHQLGGDVYVQGTVGLQDPKHGTEEVQRHNHLGCMVLLGRHLDWDMGLREINDVTSCTLHDGLQGHKTGHRASLAAHQ